MAKDKDPPVKWTMAAFHQAHVSKKNKNKKWRMRERERESLFSIESFFSSLQFSILLNILEGLTAQSLE
jgi:hypothetical protein